MITAKEWANWILLGNDAIFDHQIPIPLKELHTRIKRGVQLAVNQERDACAKLCDIEHEDPGDTIDVILTRLGAAIRNRKK